jgi:hypothetical protein
LDHCNRQHIFVIKQDQSDAQDHQDIKQLLPDTSMTSLDSSCCFIISIPS